MRAITWKHPEDAPGYSEGAGGGMVRHMLDLTELHGEREWPRQGALVDVDGDGVPELILRTGNANRARAVRLTDGETLWLSEEIAPPPAASSQISQLGVGDLDEDGTPEVILASYDGDVICLDARSGRTRWHRRLPWHINNPTLAVAKVTPGPGRNVTLVVGEDFDWIRVHARPRINMVRNPNLLVLGPGGEEELLVENYAPHNGTSHLTWREDIDGDGLCEVGVVGRNEVIWFNHRGERLFSLPCRGEGGREDAHPDALVTADWHPGRPGREIFYLDGTDGIILAGSDGEILFRELYPKELASHLQELRILPRPDGPALVAANIRAPDSKLLCLNHELELEWSLDGPTDLNAPVFCDWDGDGRAELLCGSHGKGHFNPQGAVECGFHVVGADGAPRHWHRWRGETNATILAAGDLLGDGEPLALVSVGTAGGPEGRFSLAEGHHARLFLMGPPTSGA